MVTNLIRNAKHTYHRLLSEKNNSAGSISTKEWWNLCKFIYTGKNNDHSVPPLIYNNNIIITKDAHKAEAFNDYFIPFLELNTLMLILICQLFLLNMNFLIL